MNKYKIMPVLAVVCMLGSCAVGADQTARDRQFKEDQKEVAPDVLRARSVPTIAGEVAAGFEAASGENSLGPGLLRLAGLAKQNLSDKLGIEQAAIDILLAEYVTWRDSGIGCPQPGYQYKQVLTNGSRIRLSANKQVFQYHSGGNRPPFLCEKPSAVEPLPYALGES